MKINKSLKLLKMAMCCGMIGSIACTNPSLGIGNTAKPKALKEVAYNITPNGRTTVLKHRKVCYPTRDLSSDIEHNINTMNQVIKTLHDINTKPNINDLIRDSNDKINDAEYDIGCYIMLISQQIKQLQYVDILPSTVTKESVQYISHLIVVPEVHDGHEYMEKLLNTLETAMNESAYHQDKWKMIYNEVNQLNDYITVCNEAKEQLRITKAKYEHE